MLLLREVSFELGYIPSTCKSGSSSTVGMGGRKEEMPEAGRGRTGVLDMLRLCKGSISHSEELVGLIDEEGWGISEEEVDGICKDLQRPAAAAIGPRPLRLGVTRVDELGSKESTLREDFGCKTWQEGGAEGESTVES